MKRVVIANLRSSARSSSGWTVAIALHVIAGDINPAWLKFGIRGECWVTEISTEARGASERASERAERELPSGSNSLVDSSPFLTFSLFHFHPLRLISVRFPSRSLSSAFSAASSYAGSAQTRRYRPPAEVRPCVSGRVSLPCSRARVAAGAAVPSHACAPRRGCRVIEHAPFKIKTRNRATIYFDHRALLKYFRCCVTLV